MLKIKNHGKIVPTSFPDGTVLIDAIKGVKIYDEYGVRSTVDVGLTTILNESEVTIVWLYDNDAELFQLIALTKHLKDKGIKTINLEMPYVPNARMDRTKSDDEVFTLRWFAETINWLGFNKVKITNPHSTVSEALFDRVEVDFDSVRDDVKKIVEKNGIEGIFFPDNGAMKRYADMFTDLDLPMAYGIKNRDWKTGKILGLDVVGGDALKGKRVLIVDDISSKGTTFVKSAEKLKEIGAKAVSLYVTHCEDTILKGEILEDNNDLIERVYTTNSIVREARNYSKVKIVREF